jgi:hypothetical protein
MPTTAPIAPGTVTKKMLSFDPNMSVRSTSNQTGGSTIQSSEEYSWLCGEAISAGDAVTSPDVDGKVFRATITAIDNKQAFAIAKSDYAINTLGVFQIGKKINSAAYDFDVQKTVWLILATPNVTTDLPTIASGENYQRLGKSISTTEFIINIEEPETVI